MYRKVKRVRARARKVLEHADYEWISSKMSGHGGAVGHNGKHSRARILRIGGVGKSKIFYYNSVLLFKHLKRSVDGIRR